MAMYVYPAIFTNEDKYGYSVSFPDIKGCFTQGDNLAEALLMAQAALALMLCDWEGPLPEPSKNVSVDPGEEVYWVACDTDMVGK